MFEWLNPFRRVDARARNHEAIIASALEKAEERRAVASTQAENLRQALQDFRDKRGPHHELE